MKRAWCWLTTRHASPVSGAPCRCGRFCTWDVIDRRPCRGANSNVCVAEGCYGEACARGAA